jgi:hypothetical protein
LKSASPGKAERKPYPNECVKIIKVIDADLENLERDTGDEAKATRTALRKRKRELKDIMTGVPVAMSTGPDRVRVSLYVMVRPGGEDAA